LRRGRRLPWDGCAVSSITRPLTILDRLLHRAQTIVIDGKSYRMKDRIPEENPA
jgi:DNA replication protein DnaC